MRSTAAGRSHVLIYAKRMAHEPHLQAVAARARARGALILEVSEKVLGTISRRDNPQMVIAVFGQRWSELSAIRPKDNDVWVALDRVRDPGNLGTIIRTVDAVGAKGVILVGETTDPWGWRRCAPPWARCSTCRWPARRRRSSSNGASPGRHGRRHASGGAVDYREPDYSGKPVLLLMGNEQQGLPPELAASCDRLCLIPMAGAADSLNLAVATGVMLFEVRRAALKVGPR